MPDLSIRSVTLDVGVGATRTKALDDISLSLQPGRLNLIMGPSGSGKTSLLSVLGALIRPTAGAVLLDECNIIALRGRHLDRYRRQEVGYVFQAFRLMRSLSAADNVMLSLEVRRVGDIKARCREALDLVGMSGKASLTPSQLSGGEQQRVAVARAIAHRPRIVLADEPTANLDTSNAQQIIKLLAELAKAPGRIVVVVSHDGRMLGAADRIVRLSDGRVAGEETCE